MQVTTGTVINGQIVVDGAPLPEGARVTIVARGAEEVFRLTAAEETHLLEAIEEIERGDFVTWDALRAALSKR
ncbi:MAG: hypothetical protein HZB72_03600 [Burkholderiales bacterium]|nr:hypothetical protein [Burkholderiales bacterium]